MWFNPTCFHQNFSEANQRNLTFPYWCVCLTKSEPFLNGTNGALPRQTERSGGQKGRPARNASRSEAGGGLGGRNFCPPSLSAAAEFRANEVNAPPFKSDSALLNSFS